MMATGRRGLVLLGLALAAACCCGCDAATLAYFLSPETKEDPEVAKVLNADKKKVNRILILPYLGLDHMEKDFIQTDRELAILLAKEFKDLCEANGDKLSVVSPFKVEEYKSRHPAWREEADPAAIGRQFGADFVLVVDIHSMALYEQGSTNLIFHGRLVMSLVLVDVRHPDSDPQTTEFTPTYPVGIDVQQADADMPVSQFRTKFLKHVAREIACKYLPHEKRDLINVD